MANGRRRTIYLRDTTDDLLMEFKILNNFKSMNDTIYYLLDNVDSLDIQNQEVRIKEMDKNIQILLEMIAWQCDKTDTIPSISISKGFSDAYNNSKKLVDENIERSMRLKRQGLY